MHVPLATVPLASPLLSTYLAPSSCDRNRPPRSQVFCKLLPLFPIAPLCPPFQNPNPFSDFPEPNVHLIKARLNPPPSIQNNKRLAKGEIGERVARAADQKKRGVKKNSVAMNFSRGNLAVV
jgi:hypothetical protein